MDKRLKIALSVAFVLVVAFFVARAFWPKPDEPSKPAKKVVAKKKKAPAPVKKKAAPAPATAPSGTYEMAIILDDWGASTAHLDEAIAIKRPITFAIIPHLATSRIVAEEAHAAGLGIMLHMPMQPKAKRPSEPHAILTSTSDAEIRKLLDEALASIPYVKGVNNHQGSAATSDIRVMRTVLSHLKKKGYFFIDSKVIATTQADEAAKETGIRFASRDVFIDNVAEVEAIKEELRKAIDTAIRKGSVVVIGHDKLPTLQAIKAMLPELDRAKVKLVLAEEMVKTLE
jgi:uncharacterized protein